MEKKNEYIFQFQITNAETNEGGFGGSTYFTSDSVSEDGSCENIELELFKALRYFRRKQLENK